VVAFTLSLDLNLPSSTADYYSLYYLSMEQ
jgi:hypothetical protein